MKPLFISAGEIRRQLPYAACIPLMERTLRQFSRSQIIQPLRSAMGLEEGKLLGLMPGWLKKEHVMGVKAVSVFPGNSKIGKESHQGVVLLFNSKDGSLMAALDASAITARRTAAVSAAATRLLAGKNRSTLAILGSGVQAAAHLEAHREIGAFREARIWSRNPVKAQKLAQRYQSKTLRVRSVVLAEEAVMGADVICTVTASSVPVLEGKYISKGAHINAVGACTPGSRELDSETVRKARVFVDSQESALHEAGDILIPIQEGVIGPGHIAGELGEALLGRIQGRTSENEITLFKSLGLAAQDLASAFYLYRKSGRCL